MAANKNLSIEVSSIQIDNSAQKIKIVIFSLSEKYSEKDNEVKDLIA